MKNNINKQKVEKFRQAHQDYKNSYSEFNKLDEKKRNRITIDLIDIESKSSVEIETT